MRPWVVLLWPPWLALRVLLAVALRRVLGCLSPILAVCHSWFPPRNVTRGTEFPSAVKDVPPEGPVYAVTMPVPCWCASVTESPYQEGNLLRADMPYLHAA